jgi:hypothetical protein
MSYSVRCSDETLEENSAVAYCEKVVDYNDKIVVKLKINAPKDDKRCHTLYITPHC